MFPVDIGPEHLTQFHRACATGAATVVCYGDSIVSQQADLISPTEAPWFTFVQQLRAHNPGVAITEHNYAIAACSFLEMASDHPLPIRPHWWYEDPDATWFSHVAKAEPHLVFLYSGGNDGYGFNTIAFQKLVDQLNALPKPPSLVFGITYMPSRETEINAYNEKETQDGIHFVTGWVRAYCKRNGYAFLDFMRWHNRCRDGYDSTEITCTLADPAPGTALTQYPSAPFFGDANSEISFPDNTNEHGIAGNRLTDFYINFTLLQRFETALHITLSDSRKNLARPQHNLFSLAVHNGYFEYWWSDGLHDFIDRTMTALPVPDGPLTLSIALKNELLTVSMIPQSKTAMGVPATEFGKETICALNVVRFGAPFRPVIAGIPPGQALTINNLCVANRAIVTDNFRRFKPTISQQEIYQVLRNAGGSGAYHLNAYGVQKILNPVIKSANFRPPTAPSRTPPPIISGSRATDAPAILEAMLQALAAAGLIQDKTTP
jgi:hypothetical protein